MHAFRARLCFLQIGTDGDIWLLDTLVPGVKASAVTGLFGDPARTKVFHAAQGDLQFLAEAGVRVRGLFDTHRAATLLGWPKVGLADLVAERLGVTLDKAHQRSASLCVRSPEMRRCNDGSAAPDRARTAGENGGDGVDLVGVDLDERLTDGVARPAVAPLDEIPRTATQRTGRLPATTSTGSARCGWPGPGLDVPMGGCSQRRLRAGDRRRGLAGAVAHAGVRGRVVREHGVQGAIAARRDARGRRP